MKAYAQLSGRAIGWPVECAECHAEMVRLWFSDDLEHPVNNCRYSGKRFESPTVEIELKAK